MTYFACWLTGACACPVNVEEREERKRFILERGRCVFAVAEEAFAGGIFKLMDEGQVPVRNLVTVEALLEQVAPLEPVPLLALPQDTEGFLVYTSGTTGDPKGVLLRHRQLLANASATAAWHDLRPGDGIMTVLPIHHVNGAIVTGLTSFLAGARNILSRRFSPSTFWRFLAEEKVQVASVVPTLLEFLLAEDEDLSTYDLSSLRYLLCGAGPLLSETVVRFESRFGVPICHGFGMSEATAYNTQFPMEVTAQERRHWYTFHGFPSVGCAIACNEVTILRPDGTRAGPLEPGEIAVRGASVMDGYLSDPEANAQAFRDGWFLSGDQGFFATDHQGRAFFFVSGRMKELIIRGGTNISPLEIDEVLKRVPGVAFALAVPFENTFYGEEVAAYIVPEAGAELLQAEVLAFAREHLPHAKCPKVVLFGSEVPFTTTGKPKRLELSRLLAPTLGAYRGVQFREGKHHR
jgi:long-chain acyl-CoA synthetase